MVRRVAESSDEEASSYDEEAAALGLPTNILDDDAAGGGAPADAREPIYDVEALHERLEDIGWVDGAPWVEVQAVTSALPCVVADVDDDLSRELAFYQQALEAAKAAVGRFEAGQSPWLRPPDYYAEMVKSDDHMARVKEQLLHERTLIEAAEERRRQRESKKFAKQVQAERLKSKAQEKKRAITDVSRLRKQREKSGFEGDFDFDAALEEMDKKNTPGRGGKQQGRLRAGERPQPGKKRAYKNEKFGFGGRKRAQKRNDAVSAADMDTYRAPSKAAAGGRGRGGGAGGKLGVRGGGVGAKGGGRGKAKGAKPNRPGKQRRAAARGGK